jgi:hypothetical protein
VAAHPDDPASGMAGANVRMFTAEQANELLASLRGQVDRMREASRSLRRARPVLDGLLEKASYAGGVRVPGGIYRAMETLHDAVTGIQEQGVLVKDVISGLLDFPSERNGSIVFLCWKAGEPEVSHWHSIESGFDSRRPLD